MSWNLFTTILLQVAIGTMVLATLTFVLIAMAKAVVRGWREK